MQNRTQAIIQKLNRCKIIAIPDREGNIRLPDVKLPGEEICVILPEEKINKIVDEACLISVSMLPDGVFLNILQALFLSHKCRENQNINLQKGKRHETKRTNHKRN